tara:strand:+ start:14509 stop:15222 length:714 start_codon:yes stop_codon:yes gene_type:complete
MSLAAAKKRRAPSQPIPKPPTMQSVSQPPPAQQRPQNIQQAVAMTMSRVSELEKVLTENMKEVESKFGQQDTYIVENIPDIDAINSALEDINQRLLNLESLPRVTETDVNVSRPTNDNSAQKLFDQLSTQINMHEELFNSNDQRFTNLEELKTTVQSFEVVVADVENNKSDNEMKINTLNSNVDALNQTSELRFNDLESKYEKLLTLFQQMKRESNDDNNKVNLTIDEMPTETQSES